MKRKQTEEITTTANIPNPATTAMGPQAFHDKRRKKEKSIMLKRFREYFKSRGVDID
jgi:hypothetical protein